MGDRFARKELASPTHEGQNQWERLSKEIIPNRIKVFAISVRSQNAGAVVPVLSLLTVFKTKN